MKGVENMRYAMGREDYEELFLLGPGETDGEERRKALEAAYPQNTAGAVLELRTRGLAASAAVLDYLIERGAIPAPGGGDGHRRKWSRADIDRAAAYASNASVARPVSSRQWPRVARNRASSSAGGSDFR